MTLELRADDRPEWGGDEESYTRRSRRRLYAVVAAVAVMSVSAGGLFLLHREGKLRTGAEAPLIQADTRAFKQRPEQPGGMVVPNQDLMVTNPGRPAPAERLLPTPEAPMARPVAPPLPPPIVVEERPTPVVAEPLVPPEPPPASAAAAASPAPPPVVTPAPTKPVPPATLTAAAPAAAVRTPAPAAAAPTGHGVRLQLGALKREEAARREWERLRRHHGDLLGGLAVATPRVELGERGTFYRIQAGPIADAAKAERLCGELKQRRVGCILVK